MKWMKHDSKIKWTNAFESVQGTKAILCRRLLAHLQKKGVGEEGSNQAIRNVQNNLFEWYVRQTTVRWKKTPLIKTNALERFGMLELAWTNVRKKSLFCWCATDKISTKRYKYCYSSQEKHTHPKSFRFWWSDASPM